MSVLNISPSDFTGKYEIAFDKNTKTVLQNYIDDFEEISLQDLLGCELYDLFVADLVDGVPQTQIYLDIYNKFCIDSTGLYCKNEILRSDGMIEMVKGFVYFEYVRDTQNPSTTTGHVKTKHNSGDGVTFSVMGMRQRKKRAIDTNNAIVDYILENNSVYPTFNGKKKEQDSIFN